MDNLAGKVAIVTGAGSGIGRGTALAFADAGMNVVIADINADRAATVAEEVVALGPQGMGIRTDVTSVADLEAVRDQTVARFGAVHVIMNNVGVRADGLPENVPLAEWERVLDINVMSTVRSLQVFIPLLLQQGDGHVINTASTNALWPYSYNRLPYTASKGALIALTESLALYLRPRGIGVTCFCPWAVDTNLQEQVRQFGENPPQPTKLPLEGGSRDPLHAGRCVLEALRNDASYAFTHPDVPSILAHKGSDPEGFMREQITLFKEAL